MKHLNSTSLLHRLFLTLAVSILLLQLDFFLNAEDAVEKGAEKNDTAESTHLVRFITVSSPVDDVVFGRLKNVALELQNRATQEKRRATLVLEITPGTSQFHQVHGLAKFLASTQLSQVNTVAWIPEDVTGNNVIVALGCKEIVMHPDARMGDIGRGVALEKDEQQAVVSLVEKRHNTKINPALVLGMMDPQKPVLKIKLQVGGEGNVESRVVTPEELARLRENKTAILDVQTVKEAGVTGTLSGSQARALDILVVQNAESRSDVAALYNLPPEALREDPTAGAAPNVRLIRIDGMIEPVLEAFLERQIDRSLAEGANLLIFEIDSPGGFLLTSENLANKIVDLDPKQVRTVAYVPHMALSGAAIIALGCDEIYMHPDAQIGDAGPIEMREGGQFEHAPQKVLGPLRNSLKALANKKDRPAAIAMAMADRNLRVFEVTHRETGRVWYMSEDEIHNSAGEWIQGRVVPESEEDLLLTLDGQRAHELKLAKPPVEDFAQLKERLGVPIDLKLAPLARTWVDSLIFFLNTGFAMFLLIVIGVACIYLELHLMTGMLGIISVLCFSLFFWSRYLGGTAGWLEIVLFLLGLACIGLEIFVIPGFGVFGVTGGLLVASSVVLASQTFFNPEPYKDFEMMAETMGTLSLSIVTVVVMAMVFSRYLPHIPLFKQMILTPPALAGEDDPDEPRLRPEYLGDSAHPSLLEADHALLGKPGVALSVLRPAGKARIDDQYLDVVSEGPYIPEGSDIEVIDVSGNHIVVRQV